MDAKKQMRQEQVLKREQYWLVQAPEREAAAATDPLAGKCSCFACYTLSEEDDSTEIQRFPEETRPTFYVTRDSIWN